MHMGILPLVLNLKHSLNSWEEGIQIPKEQADLWHRWHHKVNELPFHQPCYCPYEASDTPGAATVFSNVYNPQPH